MVYSAQYGSPYAAYGNCQYGAYGLPRQNYGAWPEKKPKQAGMLYGDWQDTEPEVPVIQPPPQENIAEKLALIRQLRGQLDAEQDNIKREALRKQIAYARRQKEQAFALAARIDEEETLFMLLH